MKHYLPGDRKDKLSEMIRVNHSGELGAISIYKGQIAAARHKRQTELVQTLNYMYQAEIPHFDYFVSVMEKNSIRPSFFTPIWSRLGYTIGYITALLGQSSAMTLTVGVEDVISKHYQEQLNNIDQENHEEIYEKISQFMTDEIEHMNIGIENKAENMCGYFYFNSTVKYLTRVAIYIAKRF